MRGSRYTNEQRRKAAQAYVVSGSAKQAAVAAGVPERTARYWCQPQGAAQSPIFAELCRDERDRLYPLSYRVSEKLLDRIEDELHSGRPSLRDLTRFLGFVLPLWERGTR